MKDLNFQLSFKQDPYEKIRHFTVHPLTDDGFSQYISRDHFTYQYLNKFHPKYMKRNEERESNQPNQKIKEKDTSEHKEEKETPQLLTEVESKIGEDTIPNLYKTHMQLNKRSSNKKYHGFPSYQVPRIKANEQVTRLNKQIMKSLNVTSTNEQDLLKTCEKEQEKIKVLYTTQDKAFKSSKVSLINSHHLPMLKSNQGNRKQMGIRYNPYNYDCSYAKNLTKRNVFGALFAH